LTFLSRLRLLVSRLQFQLSVNVALKLFNVAENAGRNCLDDVNMDH